MKKFIIGFLIGGSLLYGTLYFQPVLLVSCEPTSTCDSTKSVVDTTKAKAPVVELSPVVGNSGEIQKDSVK